VFARYRKADPEKKLTTDGTDMARLLYDNKRTMSIVQSDCIALFELLLPDWAGCKPFATLMNNPG
jgi:hypothetical protein